MTEDTNNKTCGTGACSKGFNYCFWAKLIVAIPALPMIAIVAASFFPSGSSLQISAGVLAVVTTVWLAIKVDNLPMFLGMVVKGK